MKTDRFMRFDVRRALCFQTEKQTTYALNTQCQFNGYGEKIYAKKIAHVNNCWKNKKNSRVLSRVYVFYAFENGNRTENETRYVRNTYTIVGRLYGRRFQ